MMEAAWAMPRRFRAVVGGGQFDDLAQVTAVAPWRSTPRRTQPTNQPPSSWRYGHL